MFQGFKSLAIGGIRLKSLRMEDGTTLFEEPDIEAPAEQTEQEQQ